MKVYIGYDAREREAFRVAASSLLRRSPGLHAQALRSDRLREQGLLTRVHDARGVAYDFASQAPCATDFAISRFFVPLLAHSGWALFVDCDVVFLEDVREIMEYAQPDKAVCVVKHAPLPSVGTKMDGQPQLAYNRKNWSSVMLFNCDHPANRRLNIGALNTMPGRDLHALYWLADSEIGELPARYNWLVNVHEKPRNPVIAHFTLGGPWFPNWTGAEHDELWSRESAAS